MRATQAKLLHLLGGPRHFIIPIYQRTYSWTESQCSQLWDDVVRVASSDGESGHFVGSVVYVEQGLYQATALQPLLVIDGQQRLTTVSLLLAALASALEEEGVDDAAALARRVRNYHLFNSDEEGDLRYKLKLAEQDTKTFWKILDGRELGEDELESALAQNYDLFAELVAQSSLAASKIYEGIQKLLVVDISLDRENDNPQLIFESLNSTGLELSESDLIRNFVLMGLEPAEQETLYRNCWRPMEDILSSSARDDEFDRFVRAWLSLRLGRVPNRRNLYAAFKEYRRESSDQPIGSLLEELLHHAKAYGRIALGRETRPELKRVFDGLRSLRIDIPMPFLLHAFELEGRGELSEGDFTRIAQWIESWLFRRAVCDIPTNVLSRAFTSLTESLDASDLAQHFAADVLQRTGRQRFPSDEEFRENLEARNLYDFRHRTHCLLGLENWQRKEPVREGEYTIEHVMPQNENLSAEWRAMLGEDWEEVHDRKLHTLGNLTLTGYNSELSDLPFATKKALEGGFDDSPLRLNRFLARATEWNEEAIEARAEELSEKAVEVWPRPTASPEALQKYKREKRSSRRKRHANAEHFDVPREIHDLIDFFIEEAGELGLETSYWKRMMTLADPESSERRIPIFLKPRKTFLLAELTVPFSEIVNPPEIASRFTYGRHENTRTRMKSEEEVRQTLALLDWS